MANRPVSRVHLALGDEYLSLWLPNRAAIAGNRVPFHPRLAELIERLKRENPQRAGMTPLRERAVVEDSADAPR